MGKEVKALAVDDFSPMRPIIGKLLHDLGYRHVAEAEREPILGVVP